MSKKQYLYTKCLITGCCFKWEVHFCKHINEDAFGDWATSYQCVPSGQTGGTRTSNARNMKELIAEYSDDADWWDELVITSNEYDQFQLECKMKEHLNE